MRYGRDACRLVLAIVLRGQLVRVVRLGELDVEDLARLGLRARGHFALRVEPVVHAVAVLRAADVGIGAVELHDALEVLDRRNALNAQEWFDRVLELLGVAVVGRIPDSIEYRSDNLALQGEQATVQVVLEDGAADWVEASRVVRVAPRHRRIDREPLPLLERIPNLGYDVEARQARIVLAGRRSRVAQQMREFRADGKIHR